jgi:malonyl-CoA O-methyltransferase
VSARKGRIERAFSAGAARYDAVAPVQRQVALNLAARIVARGVAPRRILEIGCGTGFLSAALAAAFPEAALVLTDISPAMLARCRARLGEGPEYMLLDGEAPQGLEGRFDLIVSSLALQWFGDLRGGMARLGAALAPGGRMMFATLGAGTFAEWTAAHAALGLVSGTPVYPAREDLPWPEGFFHAADEELVIQHYESGAVFARSLKELGAGEPAPGHRPLAPGAFRRVLEALRGGFAVTYHVLYGEIW